MKSWLLKSHILRYDVYIFIFVLENVLIFCAMVTWSLNEEGQIQIHIKKKTSLPGVYDINCRIQQRQASGNGAHSRVFPKGVASILKVVSGTVERLKCMKAMMENDYRLDHSKTKIWTGFTRCCSDRTKGIISWGSYKLYYRVVIQIDGN